MIAKVVIEPDKVIRDIVIAVGADPSDSKNVLYIDGVLWINSVSQETLDAAVAAYDDVAAKDKARKEFIEQSASITFNSPANKFLLDALYKMESRLLVLENKPAMTEQEFKDKAVELYIAYFQASY
ncbi:hypothetical protein C4587_01900 [Candidatus Parcubacteria bacterium]|nr:MAG: hypothetical protein C4587_01900 [Candidatus Parcubacteria bacterium]